jgi:Fe2+ transport system protein B
MLQNLEANGLDWRSLPIVIQLNKMDLPDARGEADLGDLRALVRPPVVPAVAIRSEGVVETLYALLQLAFRSVDRSIGLHQKWGISEREFLGRVFARVDVRGVRLPATPTQGPAA